MTSAVIATRGERLALTRVRFSSRDQRPEAFDTEVLNIVEIDADDRVAACVVFDPDDIEAAFEELDARYLAGEAAAHAHTWSVITRGATPRSIGTNCLATTPDWVNIDHRRGTSIAPGDMTELLCALRGSSRRTFSSYIEAVHRLNDLGAVVTHSGARDLARGLRRRVAGGQHLSRSKAT